MRRRDLTTSHRPTNRQQAGFTLLEVVIVLALTSLIGLLLMRWQWQQHQAIQTLDDRLTRQERQATALAHLRRDLARTDRLLPALSDVTAAPDVLIAARFVRDRNGYASSDTAYVVYQVQQGSVRRSVLGSDTPVLAQPVGQIPAGGQFDYLDAAGNPIPPDRSREARSVRLGGAVIRLGGEGRP
jgi:prepilin-type N-terminal cleavage/methylation domain-containing protein